MKLGTIAIVVSLTFWSAGCVTEGVRRVEPLPDEEVAQTNLELGVAYIRRNQPETAVPALERALEAEPRLPAAHSAIAVAYDQLEQFDLAEEHHRRATQLEPQNSDYQNAFAVFLCRRNRWSDARPYFDRAIASTGANTVPVMMNAGICARAGGNLDAAERYFRAVLDLEPRNAETLRELMRISVSTENYMGARGFWQRLDQATTATPDDLRFCVAIEEQLGDAAAAADCRERLNRQASRSPALERNGS